MSGGFSVIPSDLMTGSQEIAGHADGYASIGETVSGATSSGTEFGTLSVSGQLSSLTTRVATVHGQELGSACRIVKGMGGAVHDAGVNYSNADAGASTAARSILT